MLRLRAAPAAQDLLEHEDEDMMRPFSVMPASVCALDVEHTGGHHNHGG
ncbi:MAG TPA: hypothetical protein VFN67_35225 [Polyangiales bacterium]|nr:hypothetical protein [Polyangiales bacterium]